MRWLGLPIVVAALLFAASPATAVTFTVTTTTDSALPCSGTSCPSIRSALAAAGVSVGADTVVIPGGTYQLTLPGSLTVDSPVTIRGAGARATEIRATTNTQLPIRRVFTVSDTATISSLTASGGAAPGATGGNISTGGVTLLLDHVRVTAGNAAGGGGVANSEGTLTVQYSLIDGNHATAASGAASGGGILNSGSDSGGTLTVRDSTIAGNTALQGGGIFASGTAANVTRLQRVTIAHNDVSADTQGAAVSYSPPGQTFTIQGSIIAANTGDNPTPDRNCGTALPTSLGANVVSTTDCKFTAAGDLENTDPLLSGALTNAGGQTDVFTIAATSPARDHVPGCTGADQRDLARPQGPACDSGAYEIDQAPATALGGTAPSFAFSSPEPGVTFQCRLDGRGAATGTFAPCTSPKTYSDLAPGNYTFFVRAIDSAGHPDPTPASTAFTVPAPRFHKTVVVGKVSGTVLVRLKGKRKFVALDSTKGIPLGSEVDTRKGVVRLTSKPGRHAKSQSAKFYDGLFVVTQPGKITLLKLSEKLARCKPAGGASAAKKKKTRRLWGDGKGKFRTQGSYSSATVRGTKWRVSDSCKGTLTRVARGVVTVRDLVKHKTVKVRAGKRYLARAPH